MILEVIVCMRMTLVRTKEAQSFVCEMGIQKHKILSQSGHEASYHIVDEKEVAEKGKSTVIPASCTLNRESTLGQGPNKKRNGLEQMVKDI